MPSSASGGAEPPPIFHIAAAIILDTAGQLLLVRKRRTAAFMLPGGKIEPGEAAVAALERELAEEIGCTLMHAESLGRFEAPAANEAGWWVRAELFHAIIAGIPVAAAEIDAVLWCALDDPADVPLAPLAATHAMRLARIVAAR